MHVTFTHPPASYRRESPRWLIATLAFAVVSTFVFALCAQALAPEWTQATLVAEPFGFMELTGFVAPLAAASIALVAVATGVHRIDPLATIVLLVLAAGCLYIAAEEVSYGQWFFQWNTPEFWQNLNDQQETNLHNTSSWLDQKPRALLVAAIGMCSTVLPYLLLRQPHTVPRRFDLFYPPLWLTPLGLAVLVSETFQHVDYPLVDELIGALRPGEIQEFYIALWLLGYAVALWQRIAVRRTEV